MRSLLVAFGVLAVAACGDSNGPGGPSSVALLTNPRFVNYDTSDISAEASEMEFTLRSFGVAVTPVITYDSASLATALAQNPLFVIGEQEGTSSLVDSLSGGARAVLERFVDSSGGVLIVVSDSRGQALVNTIFGHAIIDGNQDDSYVLNAGATGTPFAGGPARIWNNDGTFTLDPTSLPAGARIAWQGASSGVAVATVPQGRGTIVLLAWDWYNAAPHGSQDGGWVEVLRRALRS